MVRAPFSYQTCSAAFLNASTSLTTWRRSANDASSTSACSSVIESPDFAATRWEIMPAIGAMPMPALQNTTGRPASSRTTSP